MRANGYTIVWKDLLTKPEFKRLAKRVSQQATEPLSDADAESRALGYLTKLWLLADSHIADDDTLDMGPDEVDQFLGVAGLSQVLGPNWLEVLDADQVRLPNWLAHNGVEAKKRARTFARNQRYAARQHERKSVSLKTQERLTGNGATSSPIPSHPIPSLPSEGGAGGNARAEHSPTPSGKARKGTRVPEPFEVTAEMHAWAAEKCPHVSVSQATDEFVDYWRGVAGRPGTKLDWLGTWRNRMRELEGRATRVPAGTKPVVSKGGWV